MIVKKDIRSLSLRELCSFFETNNYPAFRGNQVYNWLWNKSCFSFDEMTNLSLDLREVLKKDFVINHIKIDEIQKSRRVVLLKTIVFSLGFSVIFISLGIAASFIGNVLISVLFAIISK